MLEVKVPERVDVRAIKKEGYKALHDCQNETGGMVVFIPQDRVCSPYGINQSINF